MAAKVIAAASAPPHPGYGALLLAKGDARQRIAFHTAFFWSVIAWPPLAYHSST